MNKLQIYVCAKLLGCLLCLLGAMTSCTREDDMPLINENGEGGVHTVYIRAGMAASGETKVDKVDGETGLKVTWGEIETFTLLDVKEGNDMRPARNFELVERSSDLHHATFEGELPNGMADGEPLYAFYPAIAEDSYDSPKHMTLRLDKQKGTLADVPVYMYGKTAYNCNSENISLTFHHLVSVVRMELVFPEELTTVTDLKFGAKTETGEELLPTIIDVDITGNSPQYDVNSCSDISFVDDNGNPKVFSLDRGHLTIYFSVISQNLEDIVLSAKGNDEQTYTGTIKNREIMAGTFYKAADVRMILPINITTVVDNKLKNRRMIIGNLNNGESVEAVIGDDGSISLPGSKVGDILLEGDYVYFCIPRVVKFVRKLTSDDLSTRTIELPPKDEASFFQYGWTTGVYMGINVDGSTAQDAKPLYWSLGNLIMKKEGSGYSWHIATEVETKDEGNGNYSNDFLPSGIYESNSDGYTNCTLYSQWDKFGWGDATGLKTVRDLNAYPQGDGLNIWGNPDYDICRAKLGGAWRLPKGGTGELTEIAGLLDTDYPSLQPEGHWENSDGFTGYVYTYHYPPTEEGGDNGGINTLRLPATGYRDGTIVRHRGEYGYYWTGTGQNTTNASSVYFLRFVDFDDPFTEDGDNSTYDDYVEHWLGFRYHGMAVRAVTE